MFNLKAAVTSIVIEMRDWCRNFNIEHCGSYVGEFLRKFFRGNNEKVCIVKLWDKR